MTTGTQKMGNSTGSLCPPANRQQPVDNSKHASKPFQPSQDEKCFERGYN